MLPRAIGFDKSTCHTRRLLRLPRRHPCLRRTASRPAGQQAAFPAQSESCEVIADFVPAHGSGSTTRRFCCAQLLTQRLGLSEPEFKLEKIGTKWMGSIISKTFKGKSDRRRQKMIW